MSSAPTSKEARHVGQFGAAHALGWLGPGLPPEELEAERLAFEAWVEGHSWLLEATWSPVAQQYVARGETSHNFTPGGLAARMMWAAWRDRAVLARQGP